MHTHTHTHTHIMTHSFIFRYDEVCNDGFTFEYPNDDNVHAFTQAMWKDSLRLGVAKSTASDVGSDGLKCTFIIALYRPPGVYLCMMSA